MPKPLVAKSIALLPALNVELPATAIEPYLCDYVPPSGDVDKLPPMLEVPKFTPRLLTSVTLLAPVFVRLIAPVRLLVELFNEILEAVFAVRLFAVIAVPAVLLV